MEGKRIIYPKTDRKKRNKMARMGWRVWMGAGVGGTVKGRPAEWEPGGEAWGGKIN